MPVTVKIPRVMRDRVGGEPAVEAQGGGTLAEVIEELESKYPGLSGSLLTDAGEIRRFINLYVNGEDVRFLGALQTEVADGDTVSILPAVAGGGSCGPAA